MVIFDFTQIQVYGSYNVQAKINYSPKIIRLPQTKLISIILEDNNKHTIELIAWGKNAEFIYKQVTKGNKIFLFKNVQSIPNKMYKKCNHKAKLKFEQPKSSIKKLTAMQYELNGKTYIMQDKTKNKNAKEKKKQLAITNWFRK